MISKLRQACGAFVCLAFRGGWLCPLTDVAQVLVCLLTLVRLSPGGRQRADGSFPTAVLSLPSGGQRLTDMQCDAHGDGNSRGFCETRRSG